MTNEPIEKVTPKLVFGSFGIVVFNFVIDFHIFGMAAPFQQTGFCSGRLLICS